MSEGTLTVLSFDVVFLSPFRHVLVQCLKSDLIKHKDTFVFDFNLLVTEGICSAALLDLTSRSPPISPLNGARYRLRI
jgi:hypothetical protein